jgi:hypothetical protein
MSSDRVIRIVLTGSSDGAVRALKLVDDAAETTVSKLDRLHSAGQKMSSIGSTMTQLAVPLVAVGAYSVKSAAQFQSSMELIHTQANRSQKTVNQMSKAVLTLAPKVNSKRSRGRRVFVEGSFWLQGILRCAARGAQGGDRA